MKRETFAIASSGTLSNGYGGDGYRLTGLIVPALDSTTIGFDISLDSNGQVGNGTWSQVFTNSGTPAAATLGTADTGSKAVAVPEEIGKLAASAKIRIRVATQSGARSIIGLFEKVNTP